MAYFPDCTQMCTVRGGGLNTSVQQRYDIFDEKIKEFKAKLIPTKMVVKNFDSIFKDMTTVYRRKT